MEALILTITYTLYTVYLIIGGGFTLAYLLDRQYMDSKYRAWVVPTAYVVPLLLFTAFICMVPIYNVAEYKIVWTNDTDMYQSSDIIHYEYKEDMVDMSYIAEDGSIKEHGVYGPFPSNATYIDEVAGGDANTGTILSVCKSSDVGSGEYTVLMGEQTHCDNVYKTNNINSKDGD